jgi:hypothetical protein
MTSKFTELAIDCADPNGLARFWCSVLDYEVQDEDDGIVTIGSPMVPEGKNHLGRICCIERSEEILTGNLTGGTPPGASRRCQRGLAVGARVASAADPAELLWCAGPGDPGC